MADNSFQFMLAKTYLEGNDEEKALEGLESMKALAEGGSADAAYEVGLVYSEGCLVFNDQKEAKKWYRKAAELGHEGARAKLDAIEGGRDPKTVPALDSYQPVSPSASPSQPGTPTKNDGPAFKCGNCGHIVPIKITRRIDVTGSSDRDTAISDEDSKAPLDMGGWDEQWRMDGEHNVRVAVAGLGELLDIIRTVDAGLDPYVVAACKKTLHKIKELKIASKITFWGFSGDNGGLKFIFKKEGSNEPGEIITARESYEKIRKTIYDADFEPLRMCEVIDEFSITELLERTASFEPKPTEEFWRLKEAAKSHDPAAVFNLGVAYYNGDGVRKNQYKAFKCFREAAEHGDSDAQHTLAICFQYGEGVTRSEIRAHAWMSKSAELANPLGMYGMGVYCQRGVCGETKNIDKAIDWYRKSAEAGYGRAYLALAKIYESEDGDKKNLKEAYVCYKSALDAGYEEAKDGVERLASFASDEPPAPSKLPAPPAPEVKNDKGVAPLSSRDLIKECAEAF